MDLQKPIGPLEQRIYTGPVDTTKPFANNPLQSRDDLQEAVRALFLPLKKQFSSGYARVRIGHTGAHFSHHASELEGFARPLWGLIPLYVGGGDFADWSLYHKGFAHGCDPQHPEYWGKAEDNDQILVEMAPIGLALAMAPTLFWEPLDQTVKQNVVNWLQQINRVQVVDNNWLFFRVLVNMGLENVGAESNKGAVNQALHRIEQFYLGDGWYSDGLKPQRDYYVSFAFHYYGLIYAQLALKSDPERSQRFIERARLFAQDFVHWFAADGAALPFGRSLSYRFAQGSFWGALAFANIEGLPWGVIKGLLMRHLRWWAKQSIFNNDGTLAIGYTYPNLNVVEDYVSPGSPYWALKIFLPLALPETHPFWQAEEAPLPELPSTKTQIHPGMILCSDKNRSHIFALSGSQYGSGLRHGEGKYAKFAYSTAFGFSVPGCQDGLSAGAYDSVLALSEDNRHFRVREEPPGIHTVQEKLISRVQVGSRLWLILRRLNAVASSYRHATTTLRIENDILYSRWQPWSSVFVETWLFPMLPWHIRLHHVSTDRFLYSAEGGFALDRTEDVNYPIHLSNKSGSALAMSAQGWSGLCDLRGLSRGRKARKGLIKFAAPNTNILRPRTLIPTLVGEHKAGEHWLICAVLGLPGRGEFAEIWKDIPKLDQTTDFKRKAVIQYQGEEKVILFKL